MLGLLSQKHKNNTVVNHCFWNFPRTKNLVIMCIPVVRNQTAIYLEEGWIINFYWYGIFPNTWFESHSQYINTTLSCLENNLWPPSWCWLKRKVSLYLRHETLSQALDQHFIPTEIQGTTCRKRSPRLLWEADQVLLTLVFWDKLLCSPGWLWAPNAAKADPKLLSSLFIQCWGSNWPWTVFIPPALILFYLPM